MKTEITKSFKSVITKSNFTIYDNVGLKSTNIFWDILKEIYTVNNFEYIKDVINTIKYNSKSKFEVYYYNDRIEIFKPNKYIFPEILIIKNK